MERRPFPIEKTTSSRQSEDGDSEEKERNRSAVVDAKIDDHKKKTGSRKGARFSQRDDNSSAPQHDVKSQQDGEADEGGKMWAKGYLRSFASEAGVVGLYKLADPSSTPGSVLRKTVWTILLLFGTGFMIYQITDRISVYLSWPTKVDYQLINSKAVRFPTVTICSPCLFSRRKVMATIGIMSRTKSFLVCICK